MFIYGLHMFCEFGYIFFCGRGTVKLAYVHHNHSHIHTFISHKESGHKSATCSWDFHAPKSYAISHPILANMYFHFPAPEAWHEKLNLLNSVVFYFLPARPLLYGHYTWQNLAKLFG